MQVLHAVARHMRTARAATGQAQRAAGPALPGLRSAARDAPTPLRGHQILEITIPAACPPPLGIGDITWPHESIPVTVMNSRALRDASPGITLTPGARVNLLARNKQQSPRDPKSYGSVTQEPAARRLLWRGAHCPWPARPGQGHFSSWRLTGGQHAASSDRLEIT